MVDMHGTLGNKLSSPYSIFSGQWCSDLSLSRYGYSRFAFEGNMFIKPSSQNLGEKKEDLCRTADTCLLFKYIYLQICKQGCKGV